MNKMNIIIVGAGGFGKEVAHCLQSLEDFNLIGFADDTIERGEVVIYDYSIKYKIDELLNISYELGIVLAISDPNARKDVYKKISSNTLLSFPNIISRGINIDSTVNLGIGNIIMHGHLQTCNINIGNFNFFNGGSGLGHDVTIGNFNTFGPKSFIAGNVKIGECNFFALNSSVLAGLKIGDNNRFLVNATLFRSVKNNESYFGSPASKISF